MAIEAFRRTVGTSALLLYSHPVTSPSSDGDYQNKNVALLNVSTSPATVYLGPTGVTTTTGARWIVEAGRSLSVALEPGESLYAIVPAGTQDIDVLVNGR